MASESSRGSGSSSCTAFKGIHPSSHSFNRESLGISYVLGTTIRCCSYSCEQGWHGLCLHETSIPRGEELNLFLFLFNHFILCWSIANWQCCDCFRWTAKGLSHTSAGIHSSQHPHPPRLPRNTEQSSTCYPVGPCWLSILNTAVCTCPSQTP